VQYVQKLALLRVARAETQESENKEDVKEEEDSEAFRAEGGTTFVMPVHMKKNEEKNRREEKVKEVE